MNGAGYILLIVLLYLAMRVALGIRAREHARHALAVARLHRYAAQGRPYRYFVDAPRGGWQTVESVAADSVALPDHTHLALANVRAFIVAYPNGEVLDCHGVADDLPAGVFMPQEAEEGQEDEDELLLAQLDRTRVFVRFALAPPEADTVEWKVFTATLYNASAEAVTVERFGLYREKAGRYILETSTGLFHSHEDFAQWYGLREHDALAPQETVSDPNGYGQSGMLWAYHCVNESGAAFVAGGVIP